jgi:hypothetical protein
MDRETLVNHRIQEARNFIELLTNDQQFVFSSAYLMEDLEDDEWTLNIVSPIIDAVGFKGGYGAFRRVFEAHPEIDLERSKVRPHRTDDPVATEAIDFIRCYPAAEAFRLGAVFLKGHFIQMAYLYPMVLDGKTAAEIRGEAVSAS